MAKVFSAIEKLRDYLKDNQLISGEIKLLWQEMLNRENKTLYRVRGFSTVADLMDFIKSNPDLASCE